MSTTPQTASMEATVMERLAPAGEQLRSEFQHLRSNWFWLLLLGILLAVCGTVALVVPAVTVETSLFAMIVLGVALMAAGIGTIVTSFWAGKWSGVLIQLLVGILYLVSGFVISDTPLRSAVMMAAFVAAMFIVMGIFRIVAALVIRFPHWGWAMLNGAVTLLCGVVIYRHFRESAIWVVGVLVGVEMLFHGWNWITLAMAVRSLPDKAA